ncbi:MAG: protein kinase [Acidobacteria bacterium]|nr:protein kinase [Acidobacteriota bacterium]
MTKCSNPRCADIRPNATGRCSNCRGLYANLVLRNRYEIERMIGKGGFGITYLVKDTDCFGEYRVLKELFPHITETPDESEEDPAVTAERLFQREAKVLLNLQHPGIPKLYAYFAEGGYSYLVQDWIPGQTLYDELKSRKKTFSEQEACEVLLELSDILEYLHNQNPSIIHRDIKPQNLMRHENGKIQLIDFGAVYQAASAKTSYQTLIGSPGYAPPEQIIGSPVTQSDLYAVGATILYLLTGIHPSKMFNHTTKHMEWEAQVEVSWGFAELLTHLLLVDLTRRLKSAAELKRRVQKLVAQFSRKSGAFPIDPTSTKILPETNNNFRENRPPEKVVQQAPKPVVQAVLEQPKAFLPKDVPPIENWTSPINSIAENSGSFAFGSLSESQGFDVVDQPADEVGQFQDMPFPFLLRRIHRERLSGRLSCLSIIATKTLYFEQGAIIYAKSSLEEDGFGEVMLKVGRINKQTFDSVSKVMKEKSLRFGTALIKGGWISPEDLKTLISEQFCEITYSLFSWESGKYEIRRETPRKSSIKLSISTADIIFEGLRRIKNIDLIKKWLGDFRWKVCVTKDPILLYQSINLNPKEAFIVSRIENARSIEEILSMGGLPEDETIRTLCGLLAVGLLEWVKEEIVNEDEEAVSISQIIVNRKPQTPAFDMQSAATFCYEVENVLTNLENTNYYALLNLTRNATDEEIKQAYTIQSQKFHPDHHSQLAKYNLSLRNDLEKIFTRISEAYRVLINPITRQNYDRFRSVKLPQTNELPKDRAFQQTKNDSRPAISYAPSSTNDSYRKVTTPIVETRNLNAFKDRPNIQTNAAQSMFEKGVKYYQAYDYKQAYYAFQAATEVAPQNAEYKMFLARTLLHLNDYSKARDLFARAIELEPRNPDYHVELGLLYQRMNMFKQAYQMFEKALEIVPNHILAKRAKENLKF